MNKRKIAKNAAVSAVLCLALSGCSALPDFFAPLGGHSEPVAETIAVVERPRLEPISRNYFVLESASQSVIGEPQLVFADEENTFSVLAREYGLGYDELVTANPDVDPWLPGEGTPILLPTQYVIPNVPREGIVLNIAAKRLFYFPEVEEGQPQPVMTYPIGIGRVGWETPLGSSAVISKARDPHWYVPASVRKEHAEIGDPLPAIVPPGPENPLGKHVLKLDIPGYLIHGTNQPYGVGMRVSHGCVRLYPENIELLYDLVALGEPVNIINEPYLAGWHDGILYLESHPLLEDDVVTADDHLARVIAQLENNADFELAESDQAHAEAIAYGALGVPVMVAKSDTFEFLERARIVRNTVEPDPNMPTLAEVRALLDEAAEEEVAEKIANDE